MFNWYIGLSVMLVVLLALNVSRLRIKFQVPNGDGKNKAIFKATRAHINALEHILPYSLLLYALNSLSVSENLFALLAFGFLLCRIAHGYSVIASNLPLRRASAALTYFFELAGCALLFVVLSS